VFAIAGGPAVAQNVGDRFVPFNEFIQGVTAASPAQYVGALQSRVASVNDFEQMRQHVVSLYQGVSVRHSYVLDANYFDCVPVLQQPGARALGLQQTPSPPPGISGDNAALTDGAELATQFEPGQKDKFGNSIPCERGTIPMMRVTLERMSGFQNLREFLQKGPNGAGQIHQRKGAISPAAATHKYAHAYQFVTNYGGTSILTLWRPPINLTLNEVFSLSQHWYVSFPGGVTQTAETGWQNYPALWGSQNSALFIYWTADGYSLTGCYNLTCAAFVQTNNTVHLGAGFTHYSVKGHTIYQVVLSYWLHGGKWWLKFNNTWVGYYPATQYGAGGLRKWAQEIDYGGETVGTTIWPPMGSGSPPAQGPLYAAEHKKIIFYTTNRGTIPAGHNATLTPDQPSPRCYKIDVHNNSATTSKSYFLVGGRGGSAC
ncbi:MAG: neprosin family prolyl endopeptidase, partial [Pseudolabrys sp.]